ncbi:putative Decaheme c-type cytochrome, DmsE family [Candidatus Zixiibacteriota bacterium]|nr:putative Decaheme c-type cytochrome, DmsE family [candidate division Zixibacteria bacterium]
MIRKRRFPKLPFKAIMVMIFSLLLVPIVSAQYYSNQDLVKKSADCLTCHDDKGASLKGTPHQMMSDISPKSSIGVGCIGCHDGWEKHLDNPSAETITNIGALTPDKQAELCRRCHVAVHQAGMASADPHLRAGLGCFDCHSIHGNHNPGLVKDGDENFCATCHANVAREFKQRSAHPLNSGNIRCTDCHKMSDLKDPSLAVGMDWPCQNCHGDKAGPFIYEHPVVYKHAVNGGGCTECHNPHGSPNDRLLAQPDNGTCLQCHGIPPLHRTMHSGLGSRFACVFCHSDIHGSNTNKDFLDPDLGVKLFPNCFQAGCHATELDN